MTDDHGLLELERSECLTLLGSVPVGRLVHTAHALPAIWPCNFVLLPDAVYLRTGRGSGPWRAADSAAVVAFAADDVDVAGWYGWSVVVVGRAGLVTDPVTLRRLHDALGTPWASGERDEVVRVSLELVNGRRAGVARRHEPVAPLPRRAEGPAPVRTAAPPATGRQAAP